MRRQGSQVTVRALWLLGLHRKAPIDLGKYKSDHHPQNLRPTHWAPTNSQVQKEDEEGRAAKQAGAKDMTQRMSARFSLRKPQHQQLLGSVMPDHVWGSLGNYGRCGRGQPIARESGSDPRIRSGGDGRREASSAVTLPISEKPAGAPGRVLFSL